jgi:hypothetical protein
MDAAGGENEMADPVYTGVPDTWHRTLLGRTTSQWQIVLT